MKAWVFTDPRPYLGFIPAALFGKFIFLLKPVFFSYGKSVATLGGTIWGAGGHCSLVGWFVYGVWFSRAFAKIGDPTDMRWDCGLELGLGLGDCYFSEYGPGELMLFLLIPWCGGHA